MSPKITISINGERFAEADLSDRDTSNLLQALEDHSINRLIDPDTRKPYNEADQQKNTELRKAIAESQKKQTP